MQFKEQYELQTSCKIKSLQSDWGGKFQELTSFFSQYRIVHQVSCSHAYNLNGLAKRNPRHIVELGMFMLTYAS